MMAKDTIKLTELGRSGVTSFTSESINESPVCMPAYDSQIYQGAYGQQLSEEGDHRQQTVTPSFNGSDGKKEEQNLLYARTGSPTAIRHPTVRSVSPRSRDMYSTDSLDKIASSGNCCGRCLIVLLIIAGVLAVVSLVCAIVAFVSVMGNDCTCDTNTTTSGPPVVNNSGRLQRLNQSVQQINTINSDLSQSLANLLSDISNLSDNLDMFINNITGPAGEKGLKGDPGTQGPQGLQGITGDMGANASDGGVGLMGMAGDNETHFSNVQLFNNCNVSSFTSPCAAQCSTSFPALNGTLLERYCLIRTPISNLNASAVIGLGFGGENCFCEIFGNSTGAECVGVISQCMNQEISL